VDALDRAHDDATIGHALSGWARSEGAEAARVVTGDALVAEAALAPLAKGQGDIVITPSANEANGTRDVAVPAHTSVPGAAVFLGVPAARVDDALRRLFAVSGRIVASALARVALERSLTDEADSLRALAIGSARAFLGHSQAATEVGRLVGRLAGADATALVLGESGTGKSFVARLIHEASARKSQPFRVLNCAAIPETLVESELFGHERGAFSGAVAAHAGAFESAGRGTILLDEIGELSLASQAKLLRVLEERRYERVGSNRSQTMEARVLAATNRDLASMVEKGTFRQDLFFRISVVSIRIPPLRERGDDIVLLANQMLADLGKTAGRRVTGFSPAAIDVLKTHPWPGNVRELRNAIEHALVLGEGQRIEPRDLPETTRAGGSMAAGMDGDAVRLPAKLEWLEQRAIEVALRVTNGNRTKAAAILGINRVTLYKKLREDEGTD
jgi:two-component system, NtrC family, response regulator AtoC